MGFTCINYYYYSIIIYEHNLENKGAVSMILGIVGIKKKKFQNA